MIRKTAERWMGEDQEHFEASTDSLSSIWLDERIPLGPISSSMQQYVCDIDLNNLVNRCISMQPVASCLP